MSLLPKLGLGSFQLNSDSHKLDVSFWELISQRPQGGVQFSGLMAAPCERRRTFSLPLHNLPDLKHPQLRVQLSTRANKAFRVSV